jgi:hypothetical protein
MVVDINRLPPFPNLKSVLYNNAITGSNKKIVPSILVEPIYGTGWSDCQADAMIEYFRLHIEYWWNAARQELPAIGNIY